MKTQFYCSVCKQTKPAQKSGGTGYATKRNNHKICYECCGKQDKKYLKEMKPGEKWWLYLSKDKITNWPGTLSIKINHQVTGNHNIAGNRYDVWFNLGSDNFHGVQYGDYTQVCHIRKLKT